MFIFLFFLCGKQFFLFYTKLCNKYLFYDYVNDTIIDSYIWYMIIVTDKYYDYGD